jgi:acyl-CoA reductase-like NAD-dependent aldehyde dehydrogenase
MSSPAFPEPPAPVPPTPIARVDELVARVASKKDAWLRVGIPERIEYLRRAIDGVLAVAEEWVAGGCALKGIARGDALEGEEWIVGPYTTVRNLRLLVEALEAGGRPAPAALETRRGQTVAKVFPTNLMDRALFTGFSAEVWIEPGAEPTQGRIYREDKPASGKVALVLGAGNVSSIPPMDVVHKLFVEDEVVVLKMNPVNAQVGPHLERVFRALVDDGYLAIVHGGADVGAHLADHPQIDTLHVTGSDKTYDAIVWGRDPEERARRKASGERLNARPFTAELGCVTPILVVPGAWSDADLAFQARHVAGMVAQNASFNCNAAKVLVTAKGWAQEKAFLAKVRETLAATPSRKAYYPGAKDRWRGFLEHYPKAEKLAADGEGVVPWTLLPDVPPAEGEYALSNEAFCGVLAEVSLDASGPEDFLAKAVAFANDRCWGTLSCGVFIHPATEKAHREAFEQALADLRYGGIGVNCWPGVVYGLVHTTWGAFPGHTPEDIRSGTGFVHNTRLFDHPQKSVVRAPFRILPTPVWFADHKNLAEVGRKITRFEAAPTWGKLAGVALAALRG